MRDITVIGRYSFIVSEHIRDAKFSATYPTLYFGNEGFHLIL